MLLKIFFKNCEVFNNKYVNKYIVTVNVAKKKKSLDLFCKHLKHDLVCRWGKTPVTFEQH